MHVHLYVLVHLVFTGELIPGEATLLEADTSQILTPQNYGETSEIEPGTVRTADKDDATGQVALTLVVPTGLYGPT